jgi:hypothetical protein
MKLVFVRLGMFFLAGLVMVILSGLGVIDQLVASIAGLVVYWVIVLSLFAFLVLGVVRPFLAHLRSQDTFFARLMTNRLVTKRK